MHVQYEKKIYSPSRGEDYILYSTVVSPPVSSYSGLCTVQCTVHSTTVSLPGDSYSRLCTVQCEVVSLPGSSYSGLWTVQWSLLLGAHILESDNLYSTWSLLLRGSYSGLCTVQLSLLFFFIFWTLKKVFQCCGAGAGGAEIL